MAKNGVSRVDRSGYLTRCRIVCLQSHLSASYRVFGVVGVVSCKARASKTRSLDSIRAMLILDLLSGCYTSYLTA